jgi:hypothetical protein
MYLCNIQTEHNTVRETTMLCRFLLVQGKNCWLHLVKKTISISKEIQVEYALEIIRCDATKL